MKILAILCLLFLSGCVIFQTVEQIRIPFGKDVHKEANQPTTKQNDIGPTYFGLSENKNQN